MRKHYASLVMVVMVFAAFAYRSSAGQSAASAADIAKVADAYVKASLAGDAKAIAALYTDDAVEMPPNQPMVKGKTGIEQLYVKLFAGPAKVQSFDLTHLESKASGEIGYDVGTYRQTITDGQHPMNDTGKYTVILKRVGSAWKVAYAIYNSDMPPTPMQSGGQ